MIQLWVLPEQPGQPTDEKLYQPVTGKLTHIYGGENSSDSDFSAKTN
jgi:septal ring factor EnvC (AmiA/AmiB activator)